MSTREMEVASSSSEDDSSVESPPLIRSMDDLPSDDSVSLDSDNKDDDGNPSDSGTSSSDFEHAPDDKDIPLSERLERERDQGMSVKEKGERRDRKATALAKAKARLKKATEENSQKKKRSKNAPTEASSTRRDYFQRGAPQLNSAGIGVEIGAHKYKPRDPRMSSMSGKFSEDHFEHHYGFLEELRKKEMTSLKRRIQARKVQGKRGQKLRQKLGLTVSGAPSLEDDVQALQGLKHTQLQYERNQVEREAKRSVKRKIREEVEAGKRGAYFVKRKDLKRMEVEAQYDQLAKRSDGAIDKVLAKRRKKNKSKHSLLMG